MYFFTWNFIFLIYLLNMIPTTGSNKTTGCGIEPYLLLLDKSNFQLNKNNLITILK